MKDKLRELAKRWSEEASNTFGFHAAKKCAAELLSIIDAEDSKRLKALVAMRDRWAADEREHLMTFGQHLPASLACLIEQFDEIMQGKS